MIRSDKIDALTAALSAAQGEFEAVDKSATNPFFRSAYAPLPEVVKAAAPILSKHGLAVWQGADAVGASSDVHEILWTVVLHSSGQYIGSSALLLPVKNDSQAQGSAISYQRRYQYMAALGLVADEDDDGNAAVKAGNRKPSSRKAARPRPTTPPPASDGHSKAQDAADGALGTNTQVKEIAELARAKKLDLAEWQALAKEAGAEGKKSHELTQDQSDWVILKLRGMDK